MREKNSVFFCLFVCLFVYLGHDNSAQAPGVILVIFWISSLWADYAKNPLLLPVAKNGLNMPRPVWHFNRRKTKFQTCINMIFDNNKFTRLSLSLFFFFFLLMIWMKSYYCVTTWSIYFQTGSSFQLRQCSYNHLCVCLKQGPIVSAT